jgi:hypothetical protein
MTLTGFVISAREVKDSLSASVFESVGILVLDASHGGSVFRRLPVALYLYLEDNTSASWI